MKFVYKPEGAEPRVWDFDPTRLMSPEVEAVERHTGLTFHEWIVAVGSGSFLAIHGLLYVMLKRTHPTLKWDEVQFCMADLDFQMDDDEIANIVTTLRAKQDGDGLTEAEAATLKDLVGRLPDVELVAPKE